MNKTLLLSALLAAGSLYSSAADFQAPAIYPEACFQGISPNGRWLAASLNGTVTILDLQEDKRYDYYETGSYFYTEGLGNYVSNVGVVLGGTTTNSDAAYWENGEWHSLNVPNPDMSNLSCGITPDASRIVGSVGTAPVSIDGDNLMLAPAYWDRLPDGSYSDAKLLPRPELDFTGRVPQHITAISVSEDGKTVGGQIMDCQGTLITPIIYIQDAEGNWTYKALTELINPQNIQLPENPGESPAGPTIEQFMTETEKATYDKAYADWEADGYDYSKYPNAADYISAEGYAQYEAAYYAYIEEFNAWNEKFMAFSDTYWEIYDTAIPFIFNNVCMTPDGKNYYSTGEVEDNSDPFAWPPVSISTPYAISTSDWKATPVDTQGRSLSVTSVANNSTIMLCNGVAAVPMEGYMHTNGTITPIKDYLHSLSPELKTWMDETLKIETETGYDPDTFEPIYGEVYMTGMLLASADLQTLSMWNNDPLGYGFCKGYLFDLKQYGGISGATADASGADVAFDAAGNLVVTGDVTSLQVYDLSGRCLFAAQAPQGTVNCPLASGVYVVRALTPAGAIVRKLAK